MAVGKNYEKRFLTFHREHPEVYYELLRLLLQARASGAEKIGIRVLWEVMRWNDVIIGSKARGLKLNDHFTSFYARMIAERNPELAGMLSYRTHRAKGR